MKCLSIFLIATITACAAVTEPIPEYSFNNGMWFDGEKFAPATVYVSNGSLKFTPKTVQAKNSVDLGGGFVVPPYCEGHNHNLGGSTEGVEETVQRFLKDGVFYAMMPGSFELYRTAIADKINTQNSVDVSFSNNGLTGTGGHPRGLRESLMDRFGLYPEFTKETLPDKGYFEADSLTELQEKWTLVLAERPDFIKVMLFFSEEYELRKNDPKYFGRRGLNPDLLPALIQMAHDTGLRVAVHVETETDMSTALRAGADIIAHLPSYDSTVTLSNETIALAKKTNAAIVTTMGLAKRIERRSPGKYAEVLDAQRENLVRLQDAGANLVVGSDSFTDSSRNEANHLAGLGVLENRTLLNMWTRNCAQTVFPDRKIGRLADGYEASFLVLDGNPLENFENTSRISRRFKDGVELQIDD